MTDRLNPNELATFWDFSDPALSESRFRVAIDAGDDRQLRTLELQTQLARSLGLQGKFDDAKAILDGIESNDLRVQARVSLERGRILNSSGNPVDAIPSFEAAQRHAQAASDSYLEVDALHMLAIADADNSEKWGRLGVAIAESSDDKRTRGWRGALHNNLAWNLHDAGDFAAALTEFEFARDVFEESGTPEQVHIAWWSVARCLRSLGRREEALAIQRRLAADDPPDEYVAEEIAELTKTA